MNVIIRSFLCLGILATNFSIHPAYKTAKFATKGALLGTTLFAANLFRNQIKYPLPQLAQSGAYKDMDDARIFFCRSMQHILNPVHTELTELKKIAHPETLKNLQATQDFISNKVSPYYQTTSENLQAGSNALLQATQPLATQIHLQLYPQKEDCPCINGFETCPAHKVEFGEALLIKAEKLIKEKLT